MIAITRGDSGLLTITAQSDYQFTQADRAVFTVKDGSRVVKRETVTPEADGRVQIAFRSAETEKWTAGRAYKWDIRYVLEAVTDETGRVTDGREVITPIHPQRLTVIEAVGDV
ncbi:MAG: hypothetical protein ACI4PG_06145 [Candidatus Ventricola sp.]